MYTNPSIVNYCLTFIIVSSWLHQHNILYDYEYYYTACIIQCDICLKPVRSWNRINTYANMLDPDQPPVDFTVYLIQYCNSYLEYFGSKLSNF